MASRAPRKSAPKAAPKKENILPLITQLVQALDDKKAEDLRVLFVGEQSTITDYLVLATGKASTHLRALRVALEHVLDEAGAPIAGVESSDGSGWIVFDAYQVMIHLFLPDQRGNYNLEKLWSDAKEVEISSMIKPNLEMGRAVMGVAPAVAAKKAPAKKSTTKKVAEKAITPVKKAVVKKAATKKVVAKAPVAKKVAVKKSPAKKAATKKVAAKKTK